MLMMIKRSNRGKLSGSLGGKALPDMRKGVQRKRSLWSLITAAVAIALVGLFTVGVGVSYADTPSTTDSAPEHHKTLKYNSDGTYDVTLTVQGKVESNTTTNNKPVDVIIVFDRSNSMKYWMNKEEEAPIGSRRLDYSKKAADSLIATVFGSSNIDARVSVVDFGTYARVHTVNNGTSMDASHAAWYSSEDAAKKAIDSIDYPRDNRGGTNWQDAFRMANSISGSKASNGSSRNAARYVVFLSDGAPTHRNEYCGLDSYYPGDSFTSPYWYTKAYYRANGTLNDDDVKSESEANSGHQVKNLWGQVIATYPYLYFQCNDDRRLYNFNCGAEEAEKGSGTLYCIGLSNEATNMQNFADYLDTAPGSGYHSATDYYPATDTTGLNEAFENIAKDITGSNKSYKGVTITDTLSQWAEFSDQNVAVTYQKKTDKGTETYKPNTLAQVDKTTKNVTWAVNDSDGDTTLDDGAIYSITFKVRPNQAAYDRALNIKNNPDGAKSDEGVKATGEVNPDDPAIFSNVNGSADATGVSGTQITTITHNGSSSTTETDFSSAYDEWPVMHVPVSCVTVKKVWDQSVPQDMYGTVSVELQKRSGNDWVTVDGNLVLSDDKEKGWTAKKYVVAGVDDQTYRVVETKIDNQNKEAFNISYAYSVDGAETKGLTFKGRKHCEGTATITNSLKVYTLTITKEVTGNFGDTSKDFSFRLTDASDKEITNVKPVSTEVSLGSDGCSFELKHGEKLVVELPYGTAYKVVEVNSDGSNDTKYDTSISVDGKEVKTEDASYIASDGITKDTTITYKNKRDVTPDVGVDLGSGAPYAAVFGGAGLAGVIWMVLKRRNSLGI
jgi:hypothetical protein